MIKYYIAKITVDKGRYEDNRAYMEKAISFTNYEKVFQWLKGQKLYYEEALKFLETKLREINLWKYYPYSFKHESEPIEKEFKINYPNINYETFEELNEIRFGIFEIVIGKEYLSDPTSYWGTNDVGTEIEISNFTNIRPKFDK